MRKWILSTVLTSLAGYAWKNRHRVFSGSGAGEPSEAAVRDNAASA